MWEHEHVSADAHGDQKRASDHLEIQLEVLDRLIWVLRTKHRSSA